MKIEEHDGRRHRGLPDDDNDLVVKKGSGHLLLSEAEAYLLCHDLLEYLSDE